MIGTLIIFSVDFGLYTYFWYFIVTSLTTKPLNIMQSYIQLYIYYFGVLLFSAYHKTEHYDNHNAGIDSPDRYTRCVILWGGVYVLY